MDLRGLRWKLFFLTAFCSLFFLPNALAKQEVFLEEPNEVGKVLIMEYHSIGATESRWTRSRENFRQDLEDYYWDGYRAISIEDFARGHIDVPKGLKPIILSFDDGSSSQLTLVDGEVDPLSAVGIMDDFLEEYPDFGSAAVFYINQNPFTTSDDAKAALQYLMDSGRQIGHHTLSHGNLKNLEPHQIESELDGLNRYLRHDLGFSDLSLNTLAYPFGAVPKGEGMEVLREHIALGLLVGADPAYPSYHVRFSPYYVPRVQAINSEFERWGIKNRADKNPIFQAYVSDGDPKTIRLRRRSDLKLVDTAKVSEGVEVVVGRQRVPQKKQPSKKQEPIYPYQNCKNCPETERWIAYKRSALLGRLTTALGMNLNEWNGGKVLQVVEKWARSQMVAGKKKGIYLNAAYAPSEAGDALLDSLQAVGGNMVVFDVKKSVLRNLSAEQMKIYQDYVDKLHQRNLYAVVRLVVAIDDQQAVSHPDQAIQHKDGGVWKDSKGSAWLDLSHPGARKYIVDLSKKLVEMGVDEVQLDYIRFPTDGDLKSARYGFDQQKIPRWQIVRQMILEVRREMAKSGTYLSADLLGTVAWNGGIDAISTGQKVEYLAPLVDSLYPMLYPSHFAPGFDNKANPADEPHYFVTKTLAFFQELTEGTHTDLRAWVQGFTYRVSNFGPDYIREQARAVWESKTDGYVIWNASNNYARVWEGMTEESRHR